MGRESELSEEPGGQANAEAVTSYQSPLRADATGEAGPGAVPATSLAHSQNSIAPLCSPPEQAGTWDPLQ